MKAMILAAVAAFCFPALASADAGQQWYEALQKANAKAAAAVTAARDVKYGNAGKESTMANPAKEYRKLLKTLRKTLKGAALEKVDCTSAGRELGYMSVEWKTKDEDLATWIRRIPETFCGGNALRPPQVWMVKKLDGELPRAVILFAPVGEEDDAEANAKIQGIYHF